MCGNCIFTEGNSRLSRLPVDDSSIIASTIASVTKPNDINSILILVFFKYAKIDIRPRNTEIFRLAT